MLYEAKENYQNSTAVEYDRARFSGFKGRIFAYRQLRSFNAFLRTADPSSLLDVPCGTGRILEQLKDPNRRVLGADISPSMLSIAKRKLVQLNLSHPLSFMDAECLALKGNSVDCITSLKFFHLLPLQVQRGILAEFRRVAKKHLILSVPVVEPRFAVPTEKRFKRVKLFRKRNLIESLKERFDLSGLEILDVRYTLRLLSNDCILLIRKIHDQREAVDAIKRHLSARVGQNISAAAGDSKSPCLNVEPHDTKPNCYWIEVRSSGNTPKLLFAKICPNYPHVNEAQVEYQNLKIYHSVYEQLQVGVGVPRPLGIIREINAILMERVRGEEFREILRRELGLGVSVRSKERILRIVEGAAVWLKIFHRERLSRERPRCSPAFSKYAGHFMKRLSSRRLLASPISRYRCILERFRGEGFPHPMDIAEQHGDFGLANMLVNDDGEITLVDLGCSMRDSIFFDISYFLVSLQTLRYGIGFLLRDRGFIQTMQDRFIETYFGKEKVLSSFERFLMDFYSVANLLNRCNYQLGVLSGLPRGVRSVTAAAIEVLYRRRISKAMGTIEKYLESLDFCVEAGPQP